MATVTYTTRDRRYNERVCRDDLLDLLERFRSGEFESHLKSNDMFPELVNILVNNGCLKARDLQALYGGLGERSILITDVSL